MTLAMLKIARGEPVTFEDVFSGGRFLLTTILAWVVHKLLIAVPIVVATGVIIGGIVMMENQSGVAAFLLFLVVSVIGGARVHCSGRPPFDVLLPGDRPRRRGVRFVAAIVATVPEPGRNDHPGVLRPVRGLARGPPGVSASGSIFALPLISLLETVTYLALTGGATSGEKQPRFAWEEDT